MFLDDAVAVVDNLAGLFRIADAEAEFEPAGAEADGLGYHHARLRQRYRGLRVVGGELVVHFGKQDEPYEVNGRYVPGLTVATTPKIGARDALAAAQADVAALGRTGLAATASPELVVFALGKEPRLAYEVMLSSPPAGGQVRARWRYWVDAATGKVLLRYDDVKRIAAPGTSGSHVTISGSVLSGEGGAAWNITGWRESTGYYYLYNQLRRWYVYNQASSGYSDNLTYAYRSTANWGTSDRMEMSAALNFEETQLYYKNVHGRSSFNNANAYARANVHMLGEDQVNAYWDGTDFHFGQGDGSVANELSVADVCAHEFTHAVTENSADLYYYAEPGALNESFSDIFGACVEFYFQPDGRASYPNKVAGQADWLLGEDCWITSKALRDMRNPANPLTVGLGNEQPSRYKGSYWYYGSGDNAGVHINSGVQNFFFYLLAEGGSGNNDGIAYSVTGIGLANAERVAYRALTVYCGQYTDYAGARSAWISAAQDLNAAWVTGVENAWAACGVGGGGSSGDAWDPGDDSGAGATVLDTPLTTEQSHGPHSLSSSDSYDWFAVYLESGKGYNFNTGGGSGDNYGELYSDAGGSTRVAYNDDGAGNYQFSLDYSPGVSGWYYLRIRAYTVGSACSYTLKYRITSGGSATALGDALDAPDLVWQVGGSQPWFGQTAVTHDGVDAAQSGAIGHNQLSWFETTVTGPGTLTFWWRVSSEQYYDFLNFYVDDVENRGISGTVDWQRETVSIPAGDHLVSWAYEKDLNVAGGLDAAWVDEVTWAPDTGSFDGDGLCDYAVFRPSEGAWYILRSSGGQGKVTLGASGDTPAPGDFNGDGTNDPAVFRPSNGTWYIRGMNSVQWGGSGDIPVPAHYNADGVTDIAVYRPSIGTWLLRNIGSIAWGAPTDTPVPADYNGDGVADIAVYRPSNGTWYLRGIGNTIFGASTDLPMPGDYDGDGRADLAVYRPSNGVWYWWSSQANRMRASQWGAPGDVPVAGRFGRTNVTDIAVYRASTGQWFVRDGLTGGLLAFSAPVPWGTTGDRPAPGRFTGGVGSDAAVFRPSTGQWFIRNGPIFTLGAAGGSAVTADYDGDGTNDPCSYNAGAWRYRGSRTGTEVVTAWGAPTDLPVPADYNGDGRAEIAVFRASNGTWYRRGVGSMAWGIAGDVPVPMDYDADGQAEVAVFRPSEGMWYIQDLGAISWGVANDTPVPADYDGDGTNDLAVFRPSTARWYIRGSSGTSPSFQFGAPTDTPLAFDYDRDGKADPCAFRMNGASAEWWILQSSDGQLAKGVSPVWGAPGDTPVVERR